MDAIPAHRPKTPPPPASLGTKRAVLRRAFYLTLASAAVSELATILAMQAVGLGAHPFGLVAAAILPIIVSGPLFFYLTDQQHRLNAANAQLAKLASTDYLTGALNRRAFATSVQDIIAEAQATQAPGVGILLLLDADRFKQINDRFGHDAGDRALRLLTDLITAETDPHDLVSRAGGEEFAVLLKNKSVTEARQIARNISARIATAQFDVGNGLHTLSVSIGGARIGLGDDFTKIYHRADVRLYQAKKQGGGAVVIQADERPESERADAVSVA